MDTDWLQVYGGNCRRKDYNASEKKKITTIDVHMIIRLWNVRYVSSKTAKKHMAQERTKHFKTKLTK